jgi:hypothetical protein
MKKLIKQIKKLKGIVSIEQEGADRIVIIFEPKQKYGFFKCIGSGKKEYEKDIIYRLPKDTPVGTWVDTVWFCRVPRTDWVKQEFDRMSKEANQYLEQMEKPRVTFSMSFNDLKKYE